MSYAYDEYLRAHKKNVRDAFEWILKYIPEVFINDKNDDYGYQISFAHDASKSSMEEYDAYDHYFYGNNKSYTVVQEFKLAWLHHIHNNPHHWQYWVLIRDDPENGNTEIVGMKMPYNYIVEMICDWWSFSWSNGNLSSIFIWYDSHKDTILMEAETRATVESILGQLKESLRKGDIQ